jgi:hypothetical protein
VEPKLERAETTSDSARIEQRKLLSSSVMTGGNKPSISSSIGGHEEVKRFEKWDTKVPLIAASCRG